MPVPVIIILTGDCERILYNEICFQGVHFVGRLFIDFMNLSIRHISLSSKWK